jgi:hypothetical protein
MCCVLKITIVRIERLNQAKNRASTVGHTEGAAGARTPMLMVCDHPDCDWLLAQRLNRVRQLRHGPARAQQP